MQRHLTLALLIFCGVVYSQEKNITENDSIELSCRTGNENAKIDFDKGNYYCYCVKLISSSNADFDDFFEKFMEKKYGISIIRKGCVKYDYTECYSKKMTELVLKKFGSDIFEKSRKEAEKLYAKK
jgi:hypothetical protein